MKTRQRSVQRTGLILLGVCLFMLSCKGQQSQRREVSPFTGIRAMGSVSIYYTHGDTLSLTIKAKATDFDNIETRIEKGVLRISNSGTTSGPVAIYIQNNSLSSIESGGATTFRTQNQLSADSLDLMVSGSSNVSFSAKAGMISLTQSGASEVKVSGEAEELRANVAGASALKAYDLSAKHGTVITTGAANAKVFVSGSITASAAGASEIKIKGDPKDISSSTSAAASITRIKDGKEKGSDTTAYNWNNKKILIVQDREKAKPEKDDKSSFKHWKGFSAGVNGYLSPSGSLTMNREHGFMDLNYARSFNLQLNLVERHFHIVNHNMKLVTGFGFDFHLYELANNTTLNADTSFTWGRIDTTGSVFYRKNKFRNTYLQVPLLLEFNTSRDPDKTFHIAFGVIGQYLIGSRTKQKLELDNDQYKKIRKDNYNLAPFAAKAHVNFGYRGWTFFGEYSLTPLFQEGRGPELYPFTAGLRILPFS